MVVLFVCIGNTYRSRLAEAYLKSLKIPGLIVRSAGVNANLNLNGTITVFAKQLLKESNLEKYAKKSWTQITQEELNNADIVVCMNRIVYSKAKNRGFKFPLRTYIWSIADVNQLVKDYVHKPQRIPHIAHITFNKIISDVNGLVSLIKRPTSRELIDVCLPDGTLTGRKAGIDEIHTHGLWHHGVHAAIYTHDSNLVLARRANSIIGSPGLWEFTTGGIVGAGETPEAAISREIKEELGISSEQLSKQKIFVYRYDHYLPHYGLHNRSLVHTYLVKLNKVPTFKLQPNEVDDVKVIGLHNARALIQSGKGNIGEMTHTREYNKKLLSAVEAAIK